MNLTLFDQILALSCNSEIKEKTLQFIKLHNDLLQVDIEKMHAYIDFNDGITVEIFGKDERLIFFFCPNNNDDGWSYVKKADPNNFKGITAICDVLNSNQISVEFNQYLRNFLST